MIIKKIIIILLSFLIYACTKQSCILPPQDSCVNSSDYNGEASAINSIAFSPDNQSILSGDADHTIKLWSLKGQLHKIFKGHTAQVNAVAFSPISQYILSGSHDKTLRLWDRESQCVKRMFIDDTLKQEKCIAHRSGIQSVTFSSDGEFILSGSSDNGVLKLWRVEDGTLLQTFQYQNTINSIDFSPDGTKIVLGTSNGTLSLLKKEDGQDTYQEIHTEKYQLPINSVVFSSDSQRIILGQTQGNVKILTIDDQDNVNETASIKYTETINTVLSSENMIFTGAENGEIKWRNINSLDNVWNGVSLKNDLSTFAITSDQKYFCAVSNNKRTLTVWDIKDPTRKYIFQNGSQNPFKLGKIIVEPFEIVEDDTDIEDSVIKRPNPPVITLNQTVAFTREMPNKKDTITHTIRGFVSLTKHTTLREVVINGDEVMISRENDTYSFSHKVTLKLGENIFYINARDHKNNKSKKITINIPVILKDNIPPKIILAKNTSTALYRGVKTGLVDDTDYLVATTQTFIADTETYTLQGEVTDESALKSVTIKGIPVHFTSTKDDKKWYFSRKIKLTMGNNAINITATDIHGNVAFKNISVQLPASLQAGQYYALVIGINEYLHHNNLKTAVNDANVVAGILTGQYGFQTTLLLNNEATRDNILSQFNVLKRVLKTHDHLLIYYAGHGAYDSADTSKDVSFWLAHDAEKSDDTKWISTNTIKTHLKKNPANNILVVADSCYGGTLTRKRGILEQYRTPESENESRFKYLNKMIEKKSRMLIASGGDEPVSDGQGHSVFAQVFINGLKNMKQPAFTAAELFAEQKIIEYVSNVANQTPVFEKIMGSGHDSGDFVFQKK